MAEREARRGKDPTLQVSGVRRYVDELIELSNQHRIKIYSLSKDDPKREKVKQTYYERRASLREKRDEAIRGALDQALQRLNSKVETRSFKWHLKLGPKKGKRQTYSIPDELDFKIVAKQVESVIRSGANLSSQGRNSILRALRDSLEKDYNHAIIRLDIDSFFVSIPHAKMLDTLHQLNQVDAVTFSLVKQLLEEYRGLTDSECGLPQGVGISSQLADLYLSSFDRDMSTTPGVQFYARYVDDIILVLESSEFAPEIDSLVLEKLRALSLLKNERKSLTLLTDDAGLYKRKGAKRFEYLGYVFEKPQGSKNLQIRMSDKRFKRRTRKMDLSFKAWMKNSPRRETPNHGRDGLLIDRIRFLAGNTRLHNSKSGVSVGIYFSNALLPENAPQIAELDVHLKNLIDQHKEFMTEGLYLKLRTINFVKGFSDRRFVRYSQERMNRISRAWNGEE